jgi:sec-independent protein translocase protein TatC
MTTDTQFRPALRGDAADESREDGARMSFLEHLDELRKRILYSIYGIVVACIVPFWYAGRLYDGMTGYFHQVLPDTVKMIYTDASDGFMLSMKLCILVGLVLSAPWVFTQVWLFVAPGLYLREKKIVIPFVFCSTVLFFLGAAFNHYIAFLAMWRFFAQYSNQFVQFTPTIKEAFDMYSTMALGLGAVFEIPILMFFLARFGIVTWRFLARQWKYATVLIFIVAAIITPSPDIPTQLIFAAPMFLLYGLSIAVVWMFGRSRKTPRGDQHA